MAQSLFQIFNSIQDSALVVSESGEILFGNSAAAALMECSPTRLARRPRIDEFIKLTPTLSEAFGPLNQVERLSRKVKIQFISSTGHKGELMTNVQPLLLPQKDLEGQKAVLVTLKDVTHEHSLYSMYQAELEKKEVIIVDLRAAQESIRLHSENLEHLVEDRTLELNKLNHLQKSILDSLGQGILVFDEAGRCLSVCSAMAETLLGGSPEGKIFEEAIGIFPQEVGAVQKWRKMLFQGVLNFADMAPLGPKKLGIDRTKEIFLSYHPMWNSMNHLVAVVVAATDRTAEILAKREAFHEKELVQRVSLIVKNREAFQNYFRFCTEAFAKLASPKDLTSDQIRYLVHTIKGLASIYAFNQLTTKCHEFESLLFKSESNSLERHTMLITTQAWARDSLELLMSDVQDLALIIGPLGTEIAGQALEIEIAELQSWGYGLLSATTTQAQEIGTHILLKCVERPVGVVLSGMKSSIVDLAHRLGKKVDSFEIIGGEIKVPVYLTYGLLPSLVHAYRNSISYGIETPIVRSRAGKSSGGRLLTRVESRRIEGGAQGDRLISISIEDDGSGIDFQNLRARLSERGLENASSLSEEQIYKIILTEGISSAETINEVSGRGIGLTAVAREVEKLNGEIRLQSNQKMGFIISISVKISNQILFPGTQAAQVYDATSPRKRYG